MRKLFFTIPGMFFIFLFPLNAQVLDPVGWEISTEHVERNIFEVTFKASIEGKWHMYGMDIPPDGPVATSFTFDPSNDFNLSGDVKALTEPERKYDPSFDMEIEMHGDEAVFVQEIEVLRSVPFQVSGYIEYMSCDDHMCLPPKEKEFSIEIKPVAGVETNEEKKEIKKAPLGLGLSADDSAPPESIEHSEVIKEVDTLDAPLDVRATKDNVTTSAKNGSLWLFFWISFGAGLLGILTPCVFPMIPMTVSFFMRGSENRTNAVTKGVVFGISIIAIYTLIGVIVSLTSVGAEVTNQLSTHWIPNAVFFLLFLIFAASFLGMFELVLPSSLVNKADKQADRGGLIGAFFMAFTLVLVSFSCTGPIVGALLVEAAGGLAMKPILGMFGFSLAFALPFTLFAIFPSWLKGLPKSGGWLNAVKVVLGFIVLAFSLKFLSNIDQAYNLGVIPRDVFLAIWIVIIFLLGMYLLGKIKFSHDSDLPYLSVPRLMLVIATFSFGVYLIPGMFGAPLKGISSLLPPRTTLSFDLLSTRAGSSNDSPQAFCGDAKYDHFLELPYGIKGYFDYEQGMQCARELNKPVFLDFKGHACAACKEMEAKVWANPGVQKILREEYVVIALYVDDRTKLPEDEWYTSPVDGRIKKTLGKVNASIQIEKYNTNSIPYYVPADHEGNPLVMPMGANFDIDAYVGFLEKGVENYSKSQ